MRSLLKLVCVVLLSLSCFGSVAAADGAKAQQPSGTTIPFRDDGKATEGGGAAALVVLLAFAAAAGAAVYLGRRFKLIPVAGESSGKIRVLESRRLDAKTTLYLVTAEDQTLLLGRCGESLVTLADLTKSGDKRGELVP